MTTWYYYLSEKWGPHWSSQHPAYTRDKLVGSVEADQAPTKSIFELQQERIYDPTLNPYQGHSRSP